MNKKSKLWTVFAIGGVIFGIAMLALNIVLQNKNEKYRDALIKISEQIEDAEV